MKSGFERFGKKALLWDDGPTPLVEQVPSYRRRLSERTVFIILLISLIAGGLTLARREKHELLIPLASRPGWSAYVDLTRGWALQLPSTWYTQRIDEDYRRGGGIHGVLISNVRRHFRRPPAIGTTVYGDPWDMRALPTLVAVQVTWGRGGGFLALRPCPPDTTLPISLRGVLRPRPELHPKFSPAEQMSMRFTAHQDNHYILSAWIGPKASKDDRRILDEIVASLGFDGVRRGRDIPQGSMPRPGDGFCEE